VTTTAALLDTHTYGLDRGLPPLYLPAPAVALTIHGNIQTLLRGAGVAGGDMCGGVTGATVTAWQVDVQAQPAVRESARRERVERERPYPALFLPSTLVYRRILPLSI